MSAGLLECLLFINTVSIGIQNNVLSTERAELFSLSLHCYSAANAEEMLAFHLYRPPNYGKTDGAQKVVKLWSDFNEVLCYSGAHCFRDRR
jgi:hypothetical protein